MNERKVLIYTRIFGVLVILVYLAMTYAFMTKARGEKNPVIEFEFVTDVHQVQDIFYTDNGEINVDLAKGLERSIKVDFVFALVYGLFLGLFFVYLKLLTHNKIYLFPAVLAIVAMIFDLLENTQLLEIISKLGAGGYEHNIAHLHLFTWIKWGTLAVALVFAANYSFAYGKVGGYITGLLTLAPVLLMFPALFYDKLDKIFAFSVVLAIVALIIFSFAGLNRSHAVTKND